jgi:hypothetical protein
MKQLFFFILSLACGVYAKTQVTMSIQLPPAGLTLKPQLWQLSLVNSGSTTMTVRVELIVREVSTSQIVFSGSSRPFSLAKGARQFIQRDMSPISYQYGNPGYRIDPNPDGFLPIGAFNICYTLLHLNSDAPETLAEECETIEIEPVGPPQLTLPEDEAQLIVRKPVFVWTPPTPFNSYSSLLYDLVLAEVNPLQSPADAIQQNLPILVKQNIQTALFQYPLSLPPLDTGKVYAWRITAKNNLSPIANSEVWTFTLREATKDSVATKQSGYFARLQPRQDGTSFISDGILRFEYSNYVNSPAVDISITDISGKAREQLKLDSASYSVKYGQNFMQMDLRKNGGLKNGHVYLLELTNSQKEKSYLKFEYRKPD